MTTLGIDLDQYKAQAKDLLKQIRTAEPDAIQRVQTNHPEHKKAVRSNFFQLADAQLVVARENGFGSWAKFKEHVLLAKAIALLDAGDAPTLDKLLDTHPETVGYRTAIGDGGYFAQATLLHHVAGNPIRCPLPSNIPEMASIILSRGADPNALCGVPGNTHSTIGLLLTSRQASEAGVAATLIDILVRAGATDGIDLTDPKVLDDPIWNGGIETARELVRRGAAMDLPQAAALGRIDVVRSMLETGDIDADRLEIALIYACVQNREEVVRLLVDHGARGDVIPPEAQRGGGQATALHNAAYRGHARIVEFLLEHGANANIRDRQWNGVPSDWASHGGHSDLADLLRRKA